MITKINKLKRFGIYQNYSWGAIDDFKKKNLIYGWNYSGKTTISMLFQVLEAKDKNKFFSGSEFEITIDHDSVKSINQDNLQSFPYHVKVFNSEYIKRLFIWDEPKAGINPISFYLGDKAGNLKTEIQKLEAINERLNKLKEAKYKPLIDDFDGYDKANGRFSAKAKEVRENYLPGVFNAITFDKSHFKKIVNAVKPNPKSFILESDVRDATKKEALAEKKFEPLDEAILLQENIRQISQDVKSILEDTAPKSISFPALEENGVLFDWVQTGIPLHVDSAECKFCTQKLPPDRIDNLNSFYSKKLKEIQDAIKSTRDLIQSEREAIKLDFPNVKEVADFLQPKFTAALSKFGIQKKKYEAQFIVLESDLKNKEGNIFNALKSSVVEEVSLLEDLESVIEVIKSHNKWLAEFDQIKADALEKILNHYVAEYLIEENYNQKESDKACATKLIAIIEAKYRAKQSGIAGLNAQLSDVVKGQTELNSTLEILLHRDDIKIEIRDDKFRLERSGRPAKNLSEGEKSAIAFAYFLTELKSLRNDAPPKLPQTIIFIDDPISSLDSNHIFQVRSLLKDFFKTEDFEQLFIATHNFEFFSMLMDSEELFHNQKKTKADFYFIKRNDSGETDIHHLPDSFRKYKSEYVSLFHILNDFNTLTDKSKFAYTVLLPNAMRRFVELYTSMKYPSSKSVDYRVKSVFSSSDGTYHSVKLLHWFSHQNQFEKVHQHDDKLLQIEEAIRELMVHIEAEDELHWKGLNGL